MHWNLAHNRHLMRIKAFRVFVHTAIGFPCPQTPPKRSGYCIHAVLQVVSAGEFAKGVSGTISKPRLHSPLTSGNPGASGERRVRTNRRACHRFIFSAAIFPTPSSVP
jgi:hypothetical protein